MNQVKKLDWQEEEALRRYKLICPLLDEKLDTAKKNQIREETAENNDISVRTIQRYEAAYAKDGFSGLVPADRSQKTSPRLPENYDEILAQAIQLKREVPTRSVNQIIFILEGENLIEKGVVKRSTLQRHLYRAGFGMKQMKKYNEGQKSTTAKRFCKPHRMMLVQADIKYGTGIMIGQNGKRITVYLSSIIDDHSRYILSSEWYESQDEYAVEDIFRKAILRYGRFDCAYCDNGKVYISKQLEKSCAMLSIRIIHAKPFSGQSKGKIEKFHQVVDDFIAEAKLKKIDNLQELNRLWMIFLDEYYHKKPHEGIREYYESKGISIPAEGISPEQEWNRDTRPLVFISTDKVAEAFRYHTVRVVDKGGCISFKGRKYEVSAALIGADVTVSYDPNSYDSILVYYRDNEPLTVCPIEIGEFCSKTPEVPQAMQSGDPVTSRFLDLLEKRHEEAQEKLTDAISYGAYQEEK